MLILSKLRAKAVLLRDLEELRARRLALENPEPIAPVVEKNAETPQMVDFALEPAAEDIKLSTDTMMKQEDNGSKSPEKRAPTAPQPAESSEGNQITTVDISEAPKEKQGPTPPSSHEPGSKPIGLGINTGGPPIESGPATPEQQNSSVDSLFDIPDNDNADGSDLIFDSMDFSLHDSATNTEGHDQSQAQNNEFDLANFGSTSQDFNMADLHTSTQTASTGNPDSNTQTNDPFAATNNVNLDLDLDTEMAGAEESEFDDLFFGGGDDDVSGGREMEHGEFDAAFFQI